MKKTKKIPKTKILLVVVLIIGVMISYTVTETLISNMFMDYVFEKCPKTLTMEEMEVCYFDLGMFLIFMQHTLTSFIFLFLLIIVPLTIKLFNKNKIKNKT